jgi:hypothetical protein
MTNLNQKALGPATEEGEPRRAAGTSAFGGVTESF